MNVVILYNFVVDAGIFILYYDCVVLVLVYGGELVIPKGYM